MPPYHEVITEATGITDFDLLEEIEDTMRHDIFHSKLDWQTREQLIQGAREALEIVTLMNDPAALRRHIETAEIKWGPPPADWQELVVRA